ncbi:hypothetical protein ES705_47480 [subsurface metagenome]
MTTSLELQHFAVLAITYAPAIDSVFITCVTNNRCHLWCYYTDKQPLRHATSRVVRGLSLPWGAYWCFVAWKSVEQQEVGDTNFHTFEVPDWSYCQTKWFTFRGTVAGEVSPSVSALFQYHHPGVIPLDIGSPAIDRRYGTTSEHTYILKENPADVDGIIRKIQLYLVNPCFNLYIFTAYEVSPDRFTTRSWQNIGAVPAGYQERPASIIARAGDYIGWLEIPMDNVWRLEADIFGEGYWYSVAPHPTLPFANHPFVFAPDRTNSLYGTS